jgi:alkylation response protein AidB-like acyl-CoA dehydrogenase
MRPWFDSAEEAFRREVVEAIVEFEGVGGYFHKDNTESWERCLDVFRALGRRNWLALTWPKELGGEGLPPAYEAILWDELAYARVVRPPFSSGIVAKALIQAGTPDQHQRYLPSIRDGSLHFALGYSEPDAGSDLTSLRTRAVRDGDHYVVTGEKCWTSLAHVADKLWLLCRTGTPESRRRGLTILMLHLRSPGVTISPIPLLDGGRLNQVKLDEVVVPVADRVGAENDGWNIITNSLAVERHIEFSPKRLQRDLDDLVAWMRAEGGLAGDPVARERIRELAVRVAGIHALSLAVLDAVEQGRDSIVEAAAYKLSYTALCQDLARAAVAFGCPSVLAVSADPEFLWRQSILETIGGGTSEVMFGIIARNRAYASS